MMKWTNKKLFYLWFFTVIMLCISITLLAVHSARLKNRIRDIEFSMFAQYNMSFDERPQLRGYYKDKYIVVRTEDYYREREVRKTTKHELGHYYYDKYLGKRHHDLWQKLYEDNTTFVSDYAKTEASEDFAETFAAITHICYDDQRLQELNFSQDKIDYFRKNLKRFFTC